MLSNGITQEHNAKQNIPKTVLLLHPVFPDFAGFFHHIPPDS